MYTVSELVGFNKALVMAARGFNGRYCELSVMGGATGLTCAGFPGQVALVTGGGRGIGFATAECVTNWLRVVCLACFSPLSSFKCMLLTIVGSRKLGTMGATVVLLDIMQVRLPVQGSRGLADASHRHAFRTP